MKKQICKHLHWYGYLTWHVYNDSICLARRKCVQGSLFFWRWETSFTNLHHLVKQDTATSQVYGILIRVGLGLSEKRSSVGFSFCDSTQTYLSHIQ